MRQRYLIAVSTSVCVVGCVKGLLDNSRVNDDASRRTREIKVDTPTPLTCTTGTPMMFVLKDPLVALDSLPENFPGSDPSFTQIPSSIAHFSAYRIDLCIENDGSATLVKIVNRAKGPMTPETFSEIIPGEDAKIEGLSDAVFGDVEKLKVTLPLSSQEGLLYGKMYLGGKTLSGSPVVFLGVSSISDQTERMSMTIAGLLTEENPFADADGKVCSSSQEHHLETWRIPTGGDPIQLKVELCESFAFGTYQWSLKKVTVVNSDNLEIQNFTQPGQLPYFSTATLHHNVCTSWLLKTESMTVGFTSFNRAGNIGGGPGARGCSALVVGAPDVPPTLESGASRLVLTGQGIAPVEITNPAIEKTVEILP